MYLHQVLMRVTAPRADSSVHRHWQEWGLLFQAPGGALPMGPLHRRSQGSTCPLPESPSSSLPGRRTSRPANRSHQMNSLSL